MSKTEDYRKIFHEFKLLCKEGRQPSSFSEYCRQNGVDRSHLRRALGKEYQTMDTIPGYQHVCPRPNQHIIDLCSRVFESYSELCAKGQKPGPFQDYCKEQGVKLSQMYNFMHPRHLKVRTLVGYADKDAPAVGCLGRWGCCEVPFEQVIFEEAGFMPADMGHQIKVSVDGHVAVSFPADTDVEVIARFVRKMGKEVGNVES